MKNRLGTYLIGPKGRFWIQNFWDISQKKFGSAYAQSLRKCSNIEILAKIEGKEAKFFSKIYEGHIRIWFRSKKKSKLSHACVPLKSEEQLRHNTCLCLYSALFKNISGMYNSFVGHHHPPSTWYYDQQRRREQVVFIIKVFIIF